jgi:EAL domain-containing protein (putative c-di-GMP-specific phosphodiesterase class I)
MASLLRGPSASWQRRRPSTSTTGAGCSGVEHTLALARALGHTVVAEATSDTAAAVLAALGCDVLTGPAPGPGVPAAEVAARLRAGTALATAPT